LSSVIVFNSPARADGWTKTDMGKPYNQQASNGLTGVSVGDGDNDNATEVYFVCGDNAHVYRYKLENGKWSSSDIATLVKSQSVYTNAILVGDGDDDGYNEVYASATDYNVWPYSGHIYQLVSTDKGWTKNDCGGEGNWGYDIAIGDGNNDSRTELFTADYDGHIYMYSKGNTWNTQDIGNSPDYSWYGWYYATEMYGVAVGDGDNDGVAEVYGGSSDNHVYRFNYSGTAWDRTDLGAGEPTNMPWYYGIQKLVIGDADNDGVNEIYAASYNNATIWQYRWNSDSGAWDITKTVSLGTGAQANDLCIGDGNSDGYNELYVGTSNKQVYEVRYNTDTASWEYSSAGSGDGAITGVDTGTVDEDTSVLEVFAASADGHGYEFYNDRVPPANPTVWSDTHPEPGTWYNTNDVHILWKDVGHDRSGIDGYSVEWDHSATTVPDEIKDFEQGTHETTKTLDDGSWYFHIRARDNSLNWNLSATHFGPVDIDTTPPESVLITINDGADYTNSKLVTLSVTALDALGGSGVTQLAFSNDGSSWSGWESFCATRTGWDLTDASCGGNDSDGPKTVSANARDAAGNEVPADKRASDGIFLDRVAPARLSVTINDGAQFSASATVSLALTARDPEPASGVAGMAFSNDGVLWGDWLDWQNSATWSLTAGAGGSDTDGTKTVYYRVQDRAGNVGGPAKATIFLDRKAPESLAITIDGGADYTNSASADLAIVAVDPDPGSKVTDMSVANAEPALGTWENFTSAKSGWSLTSGAGGTDSDGLKAVYLKARDGAGNVAGPVKDTIFLDRVRPGPLGIVINGGAKFTVRAQVDLMLKATDPDPASGVYMMQFSNDGSAWTDWEPFSSQRTYTLPGPDGPKSVYFRVEDRASNVADAASSSIILDTAPPVLSGVRVVGITDNSAIVTWSTDEDADSGVDFGLTSAYGSSKLDPAFTSAHSVPLAGLAASTAYHFRVYSKDQAGNAPAYSGDYVFITAATPDTAAPTISDVEVSGVTDRLAVVSWTTNEPADSAVDYGKDASALATRVSDFGNFVLIHSLTLLKLAPSTTYFFRVSSTDPSGNGPTTSGVRSFTTLATPDTVPPVISNVRVNGITDSLAVITWETDEPSDAAVEYGASASYGRTVRSGEMLALHEMVLVGLKASTTYHFRVRSTDASGNGPSVSEDYTFTTGALPDTTPPSIMDLRVEGVTESSASVLWETGKIADGFVEYGLTADYGVTSAVAEYSLQHSIMLQGLAADRTYHLRVRSQDPSGNIGTSADYVFRTLKRPSGPDTVPPVVSGAYVTGVTDTRAVVIWATDELADGVVEYGTTPAYGMRSSDPTPVLFHSIVLDSLSPRTTYHLRVSSTDRFGNGPSMSEDLQFTTDSSPDLTPPRIDLIRFSNLTNTSVVVSWFTDEPSNSLVEYGTSIYYDRNQTSSIFVFNHSVQLTGLSPSTTYHFRVLSADPSSNNATPSGDWSFTTLKSYTPPPPGPKPAKTVAGGFPWIWVAMAVLLLALIAFTFLLRRSAAKKLPPKPFGEMRPETPETEAYEGTAHAAPPVEEAVETLAMDEPETPQAHSFDGREYQSWAAPATTAAAVLARSPPSTRPAGPEPLRHIRCSSCRTRIPIYKEGPQEIQCPSCGRRGPYRPKAVGTLYATETPAPPPEPAPQRYAPEEPAYAPAYEAPAPSPQPRAAARQDTRAARSHQEPTPAQSRQRAPVKMTRCSGCGAPVPIYTTVYPVRISCPGCGRTGVYKGPRTY
jgi:predicted RNA-binding Zn-ribbon protein involved in translation (DUF1610 family)